MEQTTVRQARVSDVSAIARVHIDTWRAAYHGLVPDDYLARLSYEESEGIWGGLISEMGREDPARRSLHVAEGPRGVVGFAMGGPRRQGDPAYAGELQGVYVLPDHQRQGLGLALTRATVERLLDAGMRSMLVWVLADNHPSRRFYEALGGKPSGGQDIEIGGATLGEVSYGWSDISRLPGRD